MSTNEGSNRAATLKLILRCIKEVTDWYFLGVQLEIETSYLKQIEEKHGKDTERCRIEVIDFWLRNVQEPTLIKLAKAVEDMGGHNKVVQTLKTNHEGVTQIPECPETTGGEISSQQGSNTGNAQKSKIKDLSESDSGYSSEQTNSHQIHKGTPQFQREPDHIPCKTLVTQEDKFGGKSLPEQSRNTQNPKTLSQYEYGESSAYSSGLTSTEQLNSTDDPKNSSDEQPNTSNTPTTPVGCTCGYCGLYTLCTSGCSDGGSTLKLADGIWNGTHPADGCNESELEYYTKCISDAFAHLVNHTLDSFVEKNVPLNRIVVWLKQLEVYKPLKKPLPLLSKRMKNIRKAEDMEQLFDILSDYWSWYNYHLLEKLIHEFGDKDELDKYIDELSTFLTKRLIESQDSFNFGTRCGKGQKLMLVKVDKAWEGIRLEQIWEFHHNIAKILELSPHELYLSSVSKGCICLKFMIPDSISGYAIPLRTLQKKALVAAGVFMLKCGKYSWQDPNYSEHADSCEMKALEGSSENENQKQPRYTVEEDKGYEGSSESDGESDIDQSRYTQQVSKKSRSNEDFDGGIIIEGSSKPPTEMSLISPKLPERLTEHPDVTAGTAQLQGSEDEKLEHGAEVPSEKVLCLAKEDKQLGMETTGDHKRAGQHLMSFLDHNHSPFPGSTINPDEHSTETEAATIQFSPGKDWEASFSSYRGTLREPLRVISAYGAGRTLRGRTLRGRTLRAFSSYRAGRAYPVISAYGGGRTLRGRTLRAFSSYRAGAYPVISAYGASYGVINFVNFAFSGTGTAFRRIPTPRKRSQHKSDQLTQATGKEILDHLTPEFQEHIDPVALLPYLQCHALVSLADVDYICNPHWTVVNRTLRILECVSSRGPDALKRFVQCLSESTENVGHAYLAGRLHKAMKERWYEAHMDIEMIDQVDIGNKHCALQNVTSPAIPMQQAHWQDELRKSRNAVRDRRFGTVIMDFSFNSSTRTRQAKRSTLSSVQPHLLLLEPIDQQVAAASPLLLSSLKSGTPSSHGMSGIVMNVPLISSIQEGELKKSTYKFFLRSLTYQLQCPELLGKATLACSQVALELCRESSTSDKPADIDSISAGMFGARPNLSSRHNEPETISHWPDAQHGLKTVYCPPTTLM